MSTRRRRRDPDRHLIVAHTDDGVDLQLALALLPANAYGTVIIEAPADTASAIAAPSRMAVVHVRPGVLDAAVDAWLTEWMPGEAPCEGTHRVWIGDHANLDGELRGRLQWSFERLAALDVL